ncbi:hypothetical protein RHGRI_026322 [Rhododendron griersonianum]|uniref:Uncharacterized protein n=1 Tax=Rhododendron griersonianum TaxID=479676 RepID=A0AAV6ITS1_9ERIC|nr:hypothetical protein RHGRI_026322 [Rhododendron griersonianum]
MATINGIFVRNPSRTIIRLLPSLTHALSPSDPLSLTDPLPQTHSTTASLSPRTTASPRKSNPVAPLCRARWDTTSTTDRHDESPLLFEALRLRRHVVLLYPKRFVVRTSTSQVMVFFSLRDFIYFRAPPNVADRTLCSPKYREQPRSKVTTLHHRW